MYNEDLYLKAVDFAATAHKEQKYPGKPYNYVVHITSVTNQVLGAFLNSTASSPTLDINLAIVCALLHDVIEDTPTTLEEVQSVFGKPVADGVLALTKNKDLKKIAATIDSLNRIKCQPKEIWMVKMADRICNLQKPPEYWDLEKRKSYQQEAKLILDELHTADEYLSNRLAEKIKEYNQYL